MHRYVAYGLGIYSALPLPELVAVPKAPADVTIRLGQLRFSSPDLAVGKNHRHLSADETRFFWDQVGAFSVRHGQEIVVDPQPEAEARLVRLPLLGVVLTQALRQRGLLTLHASAVSAGDRAVAFVGGKGAGKSTLAAALYHRGAQLVADDVVALNGGAGKSPLVLPAFPQLKLWPTAVVASLNEDPTPLPRLHSKVDKRARQVSDRFVPQRVPLGAVYLLDQGPRLQVLPLSPQEAMIELMAHSHGARSDLDEFPEHKIQHFSQCSELARWVPVYRLRRPVGVPHLSVVRLIEAHLAEGRDAP